jgi:hypothetical protein
VEEIMGVSYDEGFCPEFENWWVRRGDSDLSDWEDHIKLDAAERHGPIITVS